MLCHKYVFILYWYTTYFNIKNMFLTFSPPIYLAQRDKYVKRVILTIIRFFRLAFFIQLLSSFLPLIPFTLAFFFFSFLHVCSLFYPNNFSSNFPVFPHKCQCICCSICWPTNTLCASLSVARDNCFLEVWVVWQKRSNVIINKHKVKSED